MLRPDEPVPRGRGYNSSEEGTFLAKFGPAFAQPSAGASMQAGHMGGSPAHLSGAATPNKEQLRVGSIGPPNLTTCPQRPQGPSSGGSGNSSQSLFKPVGVPAQNPDMLSGGFGGSHLINLDTTPELTGCFVQKTGGGGGGMVSAHQQRMLAAQAQGQGQEWAQNINALPNPGPTLDDLTQRMSGMSMGSFGAQQYPQMNNKRVPPSMAGINMMNPNLAAQLMQQQPQQPQQPHPPRTGPSKLSMMTNQQLMILAQTDMPLSKGYKTVLCKFWDHNMCAKGSMCTFAHGPEELKGYTGSSLSGVPLPSPLKLDLYKTQLCLFDMQGRCSKGDYCPYAHGLDELRAGPSAQCQPASGPPGPRAGPGAGGPQHQGLEAMMQQLMHQEKLQQLQSQLHNQHSQPPQAPPAHAQHQLLQQQLMLLIAKQAQQTPQDQQQQQQQQQQPQQGSAPQGSLQMMGHNGFFNGSKNGDGNQSLKNQNLAALNITLNLNHPQ